MAVVYSISKNNFLQAIQAEKLTLKKLLKNLTLDLKGLDPEKKFLDIRRNAALQKWLKDRGIPET